MYLYTFFDIRTSSLLRRIPPLPLLIHMELSLESFQIRQWYRTLCLLYKIHKNQSLSYLYNVIPTANTHYTFSNLDKIPYFKNNHKLFKDSFFPLVIIEWNKSDPSLRKCDGYNVFKRIGIGIVICESIISSTAFRTHSMNSFMTHFYE